MVVLKLQIIKHNNISIRSQLESGRSVLALLSFDGEKCIVGESDDLLACADINGIDIKKCYRIVFNIDCADWAFSCPPDYKDIPQEQSRKLRYYKDGLNVIGDFLSQIGLFIGIQVNETNNQEEYARSDIKYRGDEK